MKSELKKAIEENEELYKLLDIIWKVKEEVFKKVDLFEAVYRLPNEDREMFIKWWSRND